MGSCLTYCIPKSDPVPGWNDLRLNQVVPMNFGDVTLDGTVRRLAVTRDGGVEIMLEFDVDTLPERVRDSGAAFSLGESHPQPMKGDA